ncbi:MAG TPA: LON peptidase substrate-binding domain-containing protein [Steroidobacteraceae bacterium]|nr:LON peptidase substrate-binding domain-containing protein [Steroidobacteraceae bacterium]
MHSAREPAAPTAASEIALFPLNAVLFPGGPLPLRVFEPRYLDMVRHCLREQSAFGVVRILAGPEAGGEVEDTAVVGTSARITDFYPMDGGLLGLYCLGERKFRLLRRVRQPDGLNLGEVQWLPPEPALELPAEYRHLAALTRKALPALGELYEGIADRSDDAAWVGCRLAEILPVGLAEKQQWLELADPLERLSILNRLIRREAE